MLWFCRPSTELWLFDYVCFIRHYSLFLISFDRCRGRAAYQKNMTARKGDFILEYFCHFLVYKTAKQPKNCLRQICISAISRFWNIKVYFFLTRHAVLPLKNHLSEVQTIISLSKWWPNWCQSKKERIIATNCHLLKNNLSKRIKRGYTEETLNMATLK